MRKISGTIAALVLSAGAASAGTLYGETFESYAPGTFLTAEPGWSDVSPAFQIDVTKPPYNANPADDDANDDTDAIQVAIDSLPTVGGTIYFPPGVYNISRPLLVTRYAWKPIVFRGETVFSHDVSFSNSSVIKRSSAGDIFRIDIDENGQSFGFNTKTEFTHLAFQGSPDNQVTAIRGYRTRLTVRSCAFWQCYNGIHLDNSIPGGEPDYSDMVFLEHLRFDDCWGGEAIRIRGADASIINGVYADNIHRGSGIHLLYSRSPVLTGILFNGAHTVVELTSCPGTTINGLYSEGCSYAVRAMDAVGVVISGFMIRAADDNATRFDFTAGATGSRQVRLANGVLVSPGGADVRNDYPGPCNVDIDNVLLFNTGDDWDNNNPRGIRLDRWSNCAVAKCSAQSSLIAGMSFLRLQNNNIPLFDVASDGTTTAPLYVFPNGVQVLSGSASTQASLPANAPKGSLYTSTSGNLYVKTAASGGWRKCSLTTLP